MPNDDSYWTELSIHVMPAVSDIAAEVLQEVTGNGVTILPPVVGLGADEGYIIDPQAPDLLHAYVFGPLAEEERAEILASLHEAGLSEAIRGEAEWGTVRDEDWAEKYKEFYDIEKIGRIVIRPLWRDYEANPGDVVVDLDPGMAFGTGQHPTTRMCIQALQDRMHAGDYVLDLGSGSGILAIAAIALGASRCIATDTEDQAVQMTGENVGHNGMSDRIETRPGSIEAVGSDGPFDCVMANINATWISTLANDIAAQLKPGGWVAAAGIIEERAGLARDALEAASLRIDETMEIGEWRTFIASKQP
jgi:ribosomal protein L11 methyltransferase